MNVTDDFRARARKLYGLVEEARGAESAARKAYTVARMARTDAELRLRTFLEEDLRGLPLFDQAHNADLDRAEDVRQADAQGGDFDAAYYSERPQYPDLDADRSAEAEAIEKAEAARVMPDPLPPEKVGPADGHGLHYFDLAVCGFGATLWMTYDGCFEVYFDCERFGNWHSEATPHEDLRPTEEDVAAAASKATGLPFTAGDTEPDVGRVWFTRLGLPDEAHPEPWRLAELKDVCDTAAGKKVRNESKAWFVGDLDGWFRQREDRKLTQLKGVKPATEREFLEAVRAWWRKNHPTKAWPTWLGVWTPVGSPEAQPTDNVVAKRDE